MSSLETTLLNRLATLDSVEAVAELTQTNLATGATVEQLAAAALAQAESDPATVARWLEIATALIQRLGDQPALQAQLSYAQARLYVQQGNLTLAETLLARAHTIWQTLGDTPALSRSQLGLIQVLAMQGRYIEAERLSRQVVSQLQELLPSQPAQLVPLTKAHHNLATLLVYQERHRAALSEYEQAQALLEQTINRTTDAVERTELEIELAHLLLNKASALMFLDQVYASEAALHTASNLFDRAGQLLDRGRARSNLGALYLRTGRYAAALSQFEAASRDLIGNLTPPEIIPLERLRNADMLLLDQASAYLALNLLPEALSALERCAAFFRTVDQPYELGQALLSLGGLRLRLGDTPGAERLLSEALHLFTGLQNQFWQNRTNMVLAALARQQQITALAAGRLDRLLTQLAVVGPPDAPVQWDIQTQVDAHLLRLQLHLDSGELEGARQMAASATQLLGLIVADPPSTSETPALPHLALRLYQAWGAIEQAAGNPARAQSLWRHAITLLESQRATLPVEEMRSAFLDDKATLYSDLMLSLLEGGGPTALAEAFSLMERARSRVLLERLLTTLGNDSTTPANTDVYVEQRSELQQQLHLLYNRLLGEAGNRGAYVQISEQIRAHEAALQQLDWQSALPLGESQPVALADLQRSLTADQQALIFFVADHEVLAFVVGCQQVELVRHLCTLAELQRGEAEWRFQIGRAEMGSSYLTRHAERLETGWRAALMQLYQLLFAPLQTLLHAPRLLLVPHGILHQLPLHALWDGEQFLLERYECSYAPSASLALHLHARQKGSHAYRSWAGLALTDPTIPAARQEVATAARYFPQHWLYVDEQANLSSLRTAATQADILHLATHGLFRPDNAFFSVLKLADGWVDVRTIHRLALAGRLVVLSACESGAGQIRGGDEVIGLVWGFLAAGAQSLLVSLWNVHDASSARLMDDFYRSLTDHTGVARPAAALQAAQLIAIRRGQHPYYWAPFFVIGG
jgi:tetratricopeptide (TPR) repeat protein